MENWTFCNKVEIYGLAFTVCDSFNHWIYCRQKHYHTFGAFMYGSQSKFWCLLFTFVLAFIKMQYFHGSMPFLFLLYFAFSFPVPFQSFTRKEKKIEKKLDILFIDIFGEMKACHVMKKFTKNEIKKKVKWSEERFVKKKCYCKIEIYET